MVTRIPETWKRTTSFLRLMASNYQAKTSHQKGEKWWNRKPAKCKGQRSWFPSKVPFRAQKVLVIFQASQKLAKTNISSVIRHQRNSNNLLLCHYVELSTQRQPLKGQSLRKQQIVQWLLPEERGGHLGAASINSEFRLLDFVGLFRLFLFFILILCGSPANWFCVIVEWLWGSEPKVVGSAFTPSSMGSDHRILKSLAVRQWQFWRKELSLRSIHIEARSRMKTCQLYQLFSCANVKKNRKTSPLATLKSLNHPQKWWNFEIIPSSTRFDTAMDSNKFTPVWTAPLRVSSPTARACHS